MTGGLARAQELTQETFIRAYHALVLGQHLSNARAWLYSVASRLATDDYRRRKLVEWWPLSKMETDTSPGPEVTVTERVALQAALDKLSPKYRVPLVLYVYADFSVAEVADALNLKVSAVKMRLCRAREMLRQTYGQKENR